MTRFFTDKEKEDGFLKIQSILHSSEPRMVGRLSGFETDFVGRELAGFPTNGVFYPYLENNAGIYIRNEIDKSFYITCYKHAVLECLKERNLLGVWDGQMAEQSSCLINFIKSYNNNDSFIPAHALEPFYFFNSSNYNLPEILNGKKILIISSHKSSIENQLDKLDLVWSGNNFFKNNKFFVYRPPCQFAGNGDGAPWSEHFTKMCDDLREIKNEFDFDLALVSCGGFGLITTHFIYKTLKKTALHIGGPLQLFFGIMGSRWENNEIIKKYRNENWIYPLDIDKPKFPGMVEGGCYW